MKDQLIGMNIKQKVRKKIRQMNIDMDTLSNIDTFLNQILLELIHYLFYFIQTKMAMLKALKLEDIIYQKA